MVKEAKALFEAKFSVSIIFLQHISYLEKFDKEIIDDLPGINFSAINYNRLYWKGKILNAKRLFRRFYSKIFHSSCYKENIFFPEFKKLIKDNYADLYIGHTLSALPIAAWAAKHKNSKFSFDAEDYHRQETNDKTKNDLAKSIEEKYLNEVEYISTASVFISAAYGNHFPNKKIITINNFFESQECNQHQKSAANQPLKIVWFSQTIGLNRGLQNFLNKLVLLEYNQYELHLRGSHDESIKTELLKFIPQNWQNKIYFYPQCSSDELRSWLKKFDVGLALEPGFSINNNIAISNKIFQYLSARLAIIATPTIGQMWVNQQAPNVGFMLSPDSDLSLLKNWATNRDNLDETKEAALYAAKAKFNWQYEKKKLIETIKLITIEQNTEDNHLINSVVHISPGIGKFSAETVKAYEEYNYLKSMFTTLVIHHNNFFVSYLLKLFPSFKAKFKNRYFSEIPLAKIKLYPWKELCRVLAVKFLTLKNTDLIWEWAEINFDKWASRQINCDVKILHCYEHAALFSFKKAKNLGCFKILEQTSQHYNFYERMIKEQFANYPNLKSEYNEHISGDIMSRRNNRKAEEHHLADLIICNSTFTEKSLIAEGISESKIIKIPLAYPNVSDNYLNRNISDTFTFICVGSISLTKGTHILIDTWRNFFSECPGAKLILAGSNSLPNNFLQDLPVNIELTGFLNKTELDIIYKKADLLVFPTLGDGFGMVITEAMAKGLPVLTTDNSAGYDLIENDIDGFIIEAGDADALAKKMLWIMNNKSVLLKMSKLIIEKARQYQWTDYHKLLIAEVEKKYMEFKIENHSC